MVARHALQLGSHLNALSYLADNVKDCNEQDEAQAHDDDDDLSEEQAKRD